MRLAHASIVGCGGPLLWDCVSYPCSTVFSDIGSAGLPRLHQAIFFLFTSSALLHLLHNPSVSPANPGGGRRVCDEKKTRRVMLLLLSHTSNHAVKGSRQPYQPRPRLDRCIDRHHHPAFAWAARHQREACCFRFRARSQSASEPAKHDVSAAYLTPGSQLVASVPLVCSDESYRATKPNMLGLESLVCHLAPFFLPFPATSSRLQSSVWFFFLWPWDRVFQHHDSLGKDLFIRPPSLDSCSRPR